MRCVRPILIVALSLGLHLTSLPRAHAAPLTLMEESSPTSTGATSIVAANHCAAEKIEASGRYMDDVLSCHAQSPNGSAARDCRQRAARKLVATFTALERTGACKTTGDSRATASRIDMSVEELRAMLGAPSSRLCTKQKLTAMGDDADWQHGCYADAVEKGAGHSVDSQCQSRATRRFLWEFARAQQHRDCARDVAEGPEIDARIRAAASKIRATLSRPVTTCAPVEVTAFHGDTFLGNSRLAKIEHGQVGCMHADEGSVAACAFSTAPGSESGEWLESPQGRFALVGQAISREGIPGGEYIVAARVSDAAPAACVESFGLDTAGRIESGVELVLTCQVEELLQPWNTLAVYEAGYLSNFANLEVCSADSNRLPDIPTFVRSYPRSGTGPDDTFCYTGYGAALNDLNGTERDESASYLVGERFCHYVQTAGYEVPGAKRPATRTLPAPGSVNTQSHVVWRPVSPVFTIANGNPPVQFFVDKSAFLAATGASSATGPLPNIGNVTETATVGTVKFSRAPGSAGLLAIGAAGTVAAPDWYPLVDGNLIAMTYENLQVQTANPVFAVGFDVVEPNTTMPAYGGTPVDSTFEVVLYSGNTEVGRTSFNAPDDQVAFFGVWSALAFDRVTIVDKTGNADDEYFGQFYTGTIRKQ